LGCLHHPFTLPEAIPENLTTFPDGVDVAALRKSLHQPFSLPESVPDRSTELPARIEVKAPRKQYHDALTKRGSVLGHLIEFAAHVNVEAPFKQHHNTFTLPDPVPDHLTRFPAYVDVEALRRHGLLQGFRQKHEQPTNPPSPFTANTARRDTVLQPKHPARRPQGTLEELGQKPKQPKHRAVL
jgi:hypothetical protein